MKKLLSVLFILVMLIPAAFAEDLDLSGMSVEELRALRGRIDAEILSRSTPEANDVIYESATRRVVYLGYHIKKLWNVKQVVLDLEWTNLSDSKSNISFFFDFEAYADGVEVYCSRDGFVADIKPNVTKSLTVKYDVPDDAEELEIEIKSWYGDEVYKTYTIPLR